VVDTANSLKVKPFRFIFSARGGKWSTSTIHAVSEAAGLSERVTLNGDPGSCHGYFLEQSFVDQLISARRCPCLHNAKRAFAQRCIDLGCVGFFK
jgi:hypothetical protein